MNGSAQSDYIVYVDESGDHGLASIDPSYPVFVLAFCIFKKRSYCQSTVPSMQELKFKYFGHDMVVLHEREIRKALPPFQFLVNQERRTQFMAELTDLVRAADFTIIASAIHKRPLQESYAFPASPYDLAMKFCLERLQYFLVENGEEGGAVHVVFERRGTREDRSLEVEFKRVCAGANLTGSRLAFEPVFVPKSVNSTGLQLADLVARPIGRHILFPSQKNRAFEVIEGKFRRSGASIVGRGLKIFP